MPKREHSEQEQAVRKAVGASLKALAKAKDHNSITIGQAIGHWPSNISGLFSGTTWTPSVPMLHNLLTVIGATWEEFGAAMHERLQDLPWTVTSAPMTPAMREYYERPSRYTNNRKYTTNMEARAARRKLTPEQRAEIRQRARDGTLGSKEGAGREYGVSAKTIDKTIKSED